MKKIIFFALIIMFIAPLRILCVTYQEAGVSITTAKNFVDIIKPLANMTCRPGVHPEIGGFSGICDLGSLGYKDPLILSTTDGTGTKLKIAQELDRHTTIGIDLVAMNVNDLIVHGAEPLAFLDYFATGNLQLQKASEIVSGIVQACKLCNCALIGGETAQMPGIYQADDYDLAGFAIGIVEREQLLPKRELMQPGDIVVGLSSSGIHANGYSLIRTIIEQKKINLNDKLPFASHYSTIGQALLAPTTLYVSALLPLIKQQTIKGLAHITGGSFYKNIPRILPAHLGVELDMNCWPLSDIFTWLCHEGSLDAYEMIHTFNCGIGMIAIVAPENVDTVIKKLSEGGQQAYVIGKVTSIADQSQVIIHHDELITGKKYHSPAMTVLIVGSGGREHALAWKIAQSPLVKKIFVTPGNGGTAQELHVENIAIGATDIPSLVNFAKDHHIDLTIIGPEIALEAGIVDAFEQEKLACLGPHKIAARIETSKVWAKDFMTRHNIPTAHYTSFTDSAKAHEYVDHQAMPLVIKADGLAAGKGVIIAQTTQEAHQALDALFITRTCGKAGNCVVIEEFLHGNELSFIVLTDGKQVLPLSLCQDHKKRNNSDRGPNTGGMGTYSPVPFVTPELEQAIMHDIINPTLEGLQKEGIVYRGFLYAGLMITPEEGKPKVLEFNARLGDPETQPLMMRLQSDIIPLCLAALNGTLDQYTATWDQRAALGVVMTTAMYPYSNASQEIIEIPILNETDSKIFHASTQYFDQTLVTAGGRILCITALGDTVQQAAERVYGIIPHIHFPNCHFRTDIGYQAIAKY